MKRFNSILCVLDTDNISDTAIIQATKIADDHQADITFASVIETSKPWHAALRNRDAYQKNLQELTKSKQSIIESKIPKRSSALQTNIEILSGIGFIQIIRSVTSNQHDLLIKTAEDADWIDRMFGSEDMHLLRKCPCPVLILKPGQNDGFRKILATVDVNDDFGDQDKERVQNQLNTQVLEYSAAFCMAELTELHIGSAWEAYAEDFYRYGTFSHSPKDEVDFYVEQVRRECAEKLDLLVRDMDSLLGKESVQYLLPKLHLAKGKPSREIPLMAEKYDIDLILMGTVGRIGIPGLIIGNTSETILEQVKCSVLAIKPEGFQTPVL